MINKYTNKQRGLLAVIMAMVMVFAGVAIITSDNGVDADTTSKVVYVDAVNGVTEYDDEKPTQAVNAIQTALDVEGVTEVVLLSDVTVSTPVNISKSVKISGDYTVKAGAEANRVFSINNVDINIIVTFEDLSIINNNTSADQRGISAGSNTGSVKIILNDVDVTTSYYSINVAANNTNITVEVNGGTISGWCAYQTWSANSVAKFNGTTLKGYNDKTGPSDGFGTIVINKNGEFDAAGAKVELIGCTVEGNVKDSDSKNESLVVAYTSAEIIFDGCTLDDNNGNYVIAVNNNETVFFKNNNTVKSNINICFTGYDGEKWIIDDAQQKGCILVDNSTISVDAGCTVNAQMGYVKDPTSETKEYEYATLVMKAGSSGLTISEGSVEISGTLDVSEVAAQITSAGSADIVLKNLTIVGSSVAGSSNTLDIGTATIEGSVTITEGITVNNTSSIVIAENSTLNLSGTITGPVENNGTITLTSETAGVTGTVSGTGSVDTSGIASEGTISGSFDTTTVFDKNQVITATDDVVLVKGTFTFKGTFIIPEGVTITIEKDAGLVIDDYTGKLENNGTIIVQGALTVSNGAKIVNEGTISVEEDDFIASIAINSTLLNNGTIYIGEGTSATISKDLLNNGTFENEGTLSISGGNIDNAGTVTLAGAVASNIMIYMTSTDAIVTFNGVMANASSEDKIIVISDSKYKDGSKVFNGSESKVAVYLTQKESIDGLDITMQVIKDPSVTASTQYLKQLVIAGSISVAQNVDSPGKFSVAVVTDGDVVVPGDIVLSKNVIVKVDTGSMDVTGTITYTYDKDAFDSAYTSNVWIHTGVMNITGTVSGNAPMMMGKVNAVAYKIEGTSPAPDMYYYTTLAAAAESGADEIEILGTIYVNSEIVIKNGVTLDNDGTTIVINKDGKLTMATGSKLKNASPGEIDVDGTMYIEDVKKTWKNLTGIVSEVQTLGENDATFTSLANALAIAGEGDVIKLSGAAEIKADTTIPAGVTVDTNNTTLTVLNDATLTIDGTLLLKTGGALVLTPKDTTSTPIKEAGEVVLNGKIESPVGITNPIAGAYYSITEKGKITYYVEPVANAASKIATVDAYTMTINAFDGELKVGAVSFVGATDTPATVKVVGKISGDITLDLATINFNGKAFKGTVTNGTGTIALDGTNALTVKSTTKDDVKTLAVSGTFDAADEKTITVTGDVSFNGFNADDVTVDGNVKVVKAGTIGVMTVNGTIAVDNGITLTVTDIEILGTVAVAEADTAASKQAGTLKVTGNAFIGITEKAVVGASASLAGKAVVDEQMFVAAGSSFPADMVKDTPYVELCIEDKTWITVYDFADVGTVTIKADVVKNADVTGWVDENGDSVATKVGDKYVIDVVDGKVSAKIDYNIYNVTFVKAAGINDIYVDGVLVGDLATGVKIAAGQHTVSYTLANGYTGEAKMLVDGKEVSGLTFTVGGDNLDYAITLQGIEKAPAEVGGGDAPVADKDEGMDLTDILLIVLVVLIVIMAIIVALRMMRS